MRRWIWLLSLASSPALAHGTQPAVWQILASRDGAPRAVRLSEGIGVKLGDTWRFVCSARWHGPSSPPMTLDAADRLWVVGSNGLAQMAVDGTDTRGVSPAIAQAAIQGVARPAGTAVVLAADDAGGRLFTGAGDGAISQIWADAHPFVSLDVAAAASADGGCGPVLWLAGPHASGFELAQVPLFCPQAAEVTAVTAPTGSPRIRVTTGHVFVTLHTDALERLGRVVDAKWQEIAADPPTLLGPVQLGADVFVAHGGVIRRLAGDHEVPTDDTRYFTCLGEEDAGPYACARQDLRRLAADGTAKEVLFDIAWLTPPTLVGLADDDTAACWTEWHNFAQDAGLPEGVPAVDTPPRAPASCAMTRGAAPEALSLVAILLLGLRRRRAQ